MANNWLYSVDDIVYNWLYSVDDIVYNSYEIWATSEEDIFSGAKFAEL